jgi:hypothetical protein
MTAPILAGLFAVSYLGTSGAANAAGYTETDLVIGCNSMEPPSKCDPTTKTLIEKNGNPHHAQVYDPNLLNAWGIAESPTTPTRPGSPFWISDNGAGVSTLYNVASSTPLTVSKNSRVVSIPRGYPQSERGADRDRFQYGAGSKRIHDFGPGQE